MLPTYDPADWESLAPYPADLGDWAAPRGVQPLEDSPIDRATMALQIRHGGDRQVLYVRGVDEHWRTVDVDDLKFEFGGEYYIGLDRGSLSPDGTDLALRQADHVVVIDLADQSRRSYPVAGLTKPWTGRAVQWTLDGTALLLSRDWLYARKPLAYRDGWRIDLRTAAVTRLDYDPEYAAALDDGTVIADHWSEVSGHQWSVISPLGAVTDLGGLDHSAVLSQPEGHGQVWAALRELALLDGRRPWDASGLAAYDATGRSRSLLPVVGTENNGGGGQLIGWLTDSVLLFSMPITGDPRHVGVVAWEVETSRLWRGPLLLNASEVSLARH